MEIEPPQPKRPDDGPWRQAGLALSLPTLMVAGPLTGLLLGIGVNWLFGIEAPWAGRVKIIGLLLGLASGLRETIKIIKKISS